MPPELIELDELTIALHRRQPRLEGMERQRVLERVRELLGVSPRPKLTLIRGGADQPQQRGVRPSSSRAR
jgi:hypothetical protein